MKKRIVFLFIIVMTAWMTACQPTPEETIVKSKDKDLVSEVMEANQEENKEALEEDKEIIEEQIEAINRHLSMEFQPNERVRIIVDADVSIPGYDKIPMVRVVPENFSQEHMQKLIDEVFGDNPVYYREFTGSSVWSKEEIQEIVMSLRAFLQNDKLEPHVKSHIESSIEFLEENHAASMNKGEERPYDGGLIDVENNKSYTTITDVKCYLGKTQAAVINMTQSKNKTRGQMVLRNEDYGVVYNTYEPYEGIDLDKVDKSYDECRQIAESLVKKLDGEDTNMTLFSSRTAYCIGFFADYTKETAPQAYSFGFAREYNDVLVKPVGAFDQGNSVDYTKQVLPEQLSITIDNEGIWFVGWSNYTKYIETLADDVPLIGFDRINAIFEDYCGYKFTWVPQWDNVPKDATVTIDIHSVEFNLMMTIEKDSLDNYIMVPVWDFIGDINYDQELTAEDGYPVEGDKNVAVLTINAIDGSIIDREQGY